MSLKPLSSLEPGGFRFIPLGIGNAFTSRYYNASLLLLCGGEPVLIDAPAPLRKVLAEAGRATGYHLDLDVIDRLFLTHLHGDHCNGLEEYGFFRKYLAGACKPRLHLLPSLKEPLWTHRLSAAMGGVLREKNVSLDDYFEVVGASPGEVTDLGVPGLRLEPFLTKHMIPCLGFRASYGGRTLGYSADTPYDPALIEFLSPCDLIIHEAGTGTYHTELDQLLALPADLRRRIRLIHLEDSLDTRTSPIECLEQGRLYTV